MCERMRVGTAGGRAGESRSGERVDDWVSVGEWVAERVREGGRGRERVGQRVTVDEESG